MSLKPFYHGHLIHLNSSKQTLMTVKNLIQGGELKPQEEKRMHTEDYTKY